MNRFVARANNVPTDVAETPTASARGFLRLTCVRSWSDLEEGVRRVARVLREGPVASSAAPAAIGLGDRDASGPGTTRSDA